MKTTKRGLYILVVLIISAMVISCSPSGPSDEQIKQDIKAFVDHLNGNKFIGAGKIKFMGSEILGKSVDGINCAVIFKRTVTFLDTNKTETDTYSSFYKKYDTGWRCELGHCPPK